MKSHVKLSLINSDIREVSADVLVLKYAKGHYGVSTIISECLKQQGVDTKSMMPDIGKFSFVDGRRCTKFDKVLWLGVSWLHDFGYDEIEEFSFTSLEILKDANVRSIAYTMHGAGYGLDEKTSVSSQISGLLNALQSGEYSNSLQEIYLVESNYNRFRSIREVLDTLLEKYLISHGNYNLPKYLENEENENKLISGSKGGIQRHIFVAMPFSAEMEDVFYYGIQAPIYRHDLLCERIDYDVFTGDILARIKERIKSSLMVVADLSGTNPNVYLEVGYAWGVGKPVILVMKKGSALKFDVQGQKCIFYEKIRELDEKLFKTIDHLKKDF